MGTRLSQRILHGVEQAAGLYRRLVLVVGPPQSGKTTALQELARATGWPLVNVNLLLCERLLELTGRQRAKRGEPGLSNADIRRITGLNRNQVYRLMKQLRDEQPSVTSRGHGAGARYFWEGEQSE